MNKIAFTTLGCKTNHYDTDEMVKAAAAAGFEIVSPSSAADVYVINTCAVTSAADAQARNVIRRFVRRKKGGLVIVCGCSSQVDPARYKDIEGVDYVLGVRSGTELIAILKKYCTPSPRPSPSRGEGEGGGGRHHQDRARAFLKIQDGCDNLCAYCIVPFARGKSKSEAPRDVVNRAKKLLNAGHKEIVLTGVHIGRYGKDLTPKVSLHELIYKLLDETTGCRFRLSSLDPDELNAQMIEAFARPRVCKHLHLSLQSGSDEVLEMMGRRPWIDYYERAVRDLADQVHGIAVGADIITGFPGETDAHFGRTLRFVEQMPFAYLHVFPYSPRPGTKAASMKNQVPDRERKARAKKLLEISAGKRRAFYESQIGRHLDVVVISKKADEKGRFEGMSDNYVPVIMAGGDFKYREVYNVEIIKSDGEKVYGNYT